MTDKILTPTNPETYLHGGMVEINNADGAESLRLLLDERRLDDDSIYAARIDSESITLAEAAQDTEISPLLALPVYDGLRAISIILIQRYRDRLAAKLGVD